MPILIIKVAEPNAPIKDSDPSIAGHAWLSLEKEGVSTQLIGFGRNEGHYFIGKTYNDDDTRYQEYHQRRLEISDEQYQKLIDFYNNPPAYGFDSSSYNVLTNSCVDFVWKALEVAGLNPYGFEGNPVPISNLGALSALPYFTSSFGGDPATGLPWPNDTFDSIRSDFQRITTVGSPIKPMCGFKPI
ncbi:carboxylesterase family protein [Limnobacter humi]|uniref:Carboxylesterase family protein n=1 Tax=Limnobacter humi TaxID=1778671 RepID=A0ABT1WHT7_9BURK|nr:carboxylesterase family protein [Limnobacter humi]MCQ8897094.1 carboxylesterase family protein [Limnobacter humi]